MRVMAVDYGDVRTGLAVSDESGTLTGDAWVFKAYGHEAAAEMIAGEARTRGVGVIVVGYPKNMNGTLGARAEKSERLAEILSALSGCEVVLWDERLTTVSAQRILVETGRHGKKHRRNIDAVAASLILEGYLNSTLQTN